MLRSSAATTATSITVTVDGRGMTDPSKLTKFEDLPRKHNPNTRPVDSGRQKPLKQLLRQISEAEPIVMSDSLASRYTKIVGVVALYWFVSITLVFVNKALLSGQESLNAPLFITWYQCAVTAAGCYALASLQHVVPDKFSFPQLNISLSVLKQVMPLSVVFVSMITFNNLCLKYVGISFYYISRSLTTVFNVIMTYILLGQKTSINAIACCAIILFGFYCGVGEEGDSGTLSVIGTIYGVLASLSVSLYAIFIKRILPVVDNNVWLLTFYNNVNALILFVPLIFVFGEIPEIAYFPDLFAARFFLMMTAGGIFGFAIGYVTGLQVKVTSPLTHNISGTAKAAAQTVMATQWYGEVKTAGWWLSNIVVLVGSGAYARVRQLEMAAAAKETLPTTKRPTQETNETKT